MINFNQNRFILLLLSLIISPTVIAQKKYKLVLKLTPNVSYTVEHAISQQIDQEYNGQNQTTHNITRITYQYQIKDKNDDGFYDMQVVYKKVYFQNGKSFYDSDKPESGNPRMAQIFGVLIGSKLSMQINDQGKVKELTGTSTLIKKMVKVIPDSSMRKRMEKTFTNSFGKKALMESMEQHFNIYPAKSVKVGSKWSKTLFKKAGLPTRLDMSWQLKEIKGKIGIVNIKGKLRLQLDTPVDIGFAFARYDMLGYQEGTMDIELATGWAKTAYTKQELKGKMYLKIPESEEEIKVDAKITTISKFKTFE